MGEDGGLIAGHARILAARQLGIAEIPVMVAAGWSETQRRDRTVDARRPRAGLRLVQLEAVQILNRRRVGRAVDEARARGGSENQRPWPADKVETVVDRSADPRNKRR